MQAVEAIAAAYGLTTEWGNSAHLLREGLGIASIHDTALENDVTVDPAFDRGRDLFFDLARVLVGMVPAGPVEWLTVGATPGAGG